MKNIIEKIKTSDSPRRLIIAVTESDMLKDNPEILSAIFEKVIQISQDYDSGPWMETSDIREFEDDAARLLMPELKNKILEIIEKSKEPWKILKPVFDTFCDNYCFDQLEEFISSILKSKEFNNCITKILPNIVLKIKDSKKPNEIFWFFHYHGNKEHVKLIKKETKIIEVIKKLLTKNNSICENWISHRVFLCEEDAILIEQLEVEIGKSIHHNGYQGNDYRGQYVAKDKRFFEIDLRRLKLTKISHVLFSFTKLTKLELGNNLIETIPDSIGNLTNLKELILDDNKLKMISQNISKLTKLDTLYIRNNKLKSIPVSITKLEKLEYIQIENNSLTMKNMSEIIHSKYDTLSKATICFILGKYLDKKSKYKLAYEAFAEIPKITPKDIYVWNYMGKILYYNLKKYDEAENSFKRVLQFKPDNYYALTNLGHLLLTIERYEESKKLYIKAKTIDKNDINIFLNLCCI